MADNESVKVTVESELGWPAATVLCVFLIMVFLFWNQQCQRSHLERLYEQATTSEVQ